MNKTKLFLLILIASAFIVGMASVMAAPPHNDFWQQANPINPIPASKTANTTEATTGINANNKKDEPVVTCAPTGRTVWYKFTANQDEIVTINTFGSNFDTVLAVYTRSGGNNFTQTACNDDSANPSNLFQSEVAIYVTRGETYYLQIGGFGGSAGDLVLNVN